MQTEPRMVQIMPAEHWWVVWADDNGKPMYERLVGWALMERVEHDGWEDEHRHTWIDGLTAGDQPREGETLTHNAGPEPCMQASNFSHFVYSTANLAIHNTPAPVEEPI